MNDSTELYGADFDTQLVDWDQRFGQLPKMLSTEELAPELLAPELLALGAALEQARADGASNRACDQRWQRLAQLSAIATLGTQVALHRSLRWLVVLLSLVLPSALLASIYGMNFAPQVSPWSMPELFFYWGYPAVLLIMGGLMLMAAFALRRARFLSLSVAPKPERQRGRAR